MSFLQIVTKPGYPIYKQIILHKQLFLLFSCMLDKHSFHAKKQMITVFHSLKKVMYK